MLTAQIVVSLQVIAVVAPQQLTPKKGGGADVDRIVPR